MRKLTLILSLLITACGSAPVQPTVDANAIATAAFETALAAYTQTALAIPTFTPTPENTATPAPSLTPTATPAPIILTGTGDNVIDVQKWNGPAIAKITHTGGGNFAVWNNDAQGHIDLLVNTIGNYQGTVPIDFKDAEQTTRFEITAGGTWEIQILPMGQMRRVTIPGVFQGIGDDVIALDGTAAPDLLKADASAASRNFVVYTFGSRRDLAINEIAPYTGTVSIDNQTFIIVITATGPWNIEITTR